MNTYLNRNNLILHQKKLYNLNLNFYPHGIYIFDPRVLDLIPKKQSYVDIKEQLLKHIKGIQISYLTKKDVVRHPLIQQVETRYLERHKKPKEQPAK